MSNKKIYFLLIALISGLVLFAVIYNDYKRSTDNLDKNLISNSLSGSSASSKVNQSESSVAEEKFSIDYAGAVITQTLKTKLNLNLGFIWSDKILAANQLLPVDVDSLTKSLTPEEISKLNYPFNSKRLQDIIPKPATVEKTNWLSYPKFNVEAPVIYSSFQDFFESDSKGLVDFTKPIIEKQEEIDKGNYQSVPVQKLLAKGVVHLAISPAPGEIGQSYIVGHSSNYTSVKSDYNFIFSPLERKSQVGDEFYIYDQSGRKLKFLVFEAKEIPEADVSEAYRPYSNRRVVTLQGSILENVDGVFKPTKRWLTRGELVI